MSGEVTLTGKVELPSGDESFLKNRAVNCGDLVDLPDTVFSDSA